MLIDSADAGNFFKNLFEVFRMLTWHCARLSLFCPLPQIVCPGANYSLAHSPSAIKNPASF
jgi:hypothetical protein